MRFYPERTDKPEQEIARALYDLVRDNAFSNPNHLRETLLAFPQMEESTLHVATREGVTLVSNGTGVLLRIKPAR